MGSFKRPKGSNDSEELTTLDLALVDALASARKMSWRTEVLKEALRHQLFMIAGEDVTSTETLRDRALKRMNLDRLHRF